MAQYSIVTPPSGGVLALATFKQFLRLDALDVSEDTTLNLILSSVQSVFERYTGLVLQPTDFQMAIQPRAIDEVFMIAKSPVTAITSVQVSINSVFQNVSEFETKLGYNSHIHIINSSTDSKIHETYKVLFTAGLASVPDDIVLALYQHGAFAYENRGDCSTNACGFPSFITAVYDSYKVIWI